MSPPTQANDVRCRAIDVSEFMLIKNPYIEDCAWFKTGLVHRVFGKHRTPVIRDSVTTKASFSPNGSNHVSKAKQNARGRLQF